MAELMYLVSPYPPFAKAKSQSLKLAPFFSFIVVYFVFVRNPNGELYTTILKCAPIVCLMKYILLKGFDFTQDYRNSQRILLGLIFSCTGDVLLNIDLFPHGMGAFALAQICYISAFGWKPLKLIIGIPLYLVGAGTVAVLWKGLDEVLMFGLPIYTVLVLTMCWRAVVRATQNKDFLSILCAVGSVLFAISDGLIGVNMFYTNVPNDRILIMGTYYAAQFGITLSTATECKQQKSSPKRSKKSVQSRINGAEGARRRLKTRD